MKAKILKLFKQDFLINQLMAVYSLLIVVVLVGIMLGISIYTSYDKYQLSWQATEETAMQLEKNMLEKNTVIQNISYEFYSSNIKFEAMRHHIILSPTEYFNYISEIIENGGGDLYFPTTLKRTFLNYAEVESIDLVLDEIDEYYLHADRIVKSGERKEMPREQKNSLTLSRPLLDPVRLELRGQFYVSFSKEDVLGDISKSNHLKGIDSFIFSNNGEMLYSDGETTTPKVRQSLITAMEKQTKIPYPELTKDYYIKVIQSRGTTIVTLLSKKVLWLDIIRYLLLINGIGLTAMAVLLIVLNKTFKRYSSQVGTIVEVTQKVSQGQLKEKIDTSHVQQELKDLAEAINEMMASINQYIEDIYTLEIKQRDAHMRALQSQINPHFLYNTLEYIRMYALSRQQEELADVVYAFSALLRNNTTQEKTATLQAEVDFCEKYVYLYQMRYPDKIAYHVSLAEDLHDLVMPKFVIQPLVENYFVHGINYQREDNAISIKAFREAGKIIIQITDNGKGVSQKVLSAIRDNLNKTEIDLQTSIGLKNVDQRLRGFFGTSYQLHVTSERNQGFQVRIILEEGLLDNGAI